MLQRLIITLYVLITTAKAQIAAFVHTFIEFVKGFYGLMKHGADTSKFMQNLDYTLPISTQYIDEEFLKDYTVSLMGVHKVGKGDKRRASAPKVWLQNLAMAANSTSAAQGAVSGHAHAHAAPRSCAVPRHTHAPAGAYLDAMNAKNRSILTDPTVLHRYVNQGFVRFEGKLQKNCHTLRCTCFQKAAKSKKSKANSFTATNLSVILEEVAY